MKNSRTYNVCGQTICITAAFIFMFPLVLMLIRSFQTSGFGNYVQVFQTINILPNLMTSIVVVSGTLLIVAVVTSMAAFAFAKLEFKGKKLIYYLLLTGMMIPTSALIFPLYQIVKHMNLINTPLSLILPYATLNACFNLMILKNYYDALPNEVIEAATIDGASKRKVFSNIMLPIAKPGLAFVLIQTFLNAWNELQMGMIFINDTSKQPLSIVPLRFSQALAAGVQGFPLEVMYAALVICLLPIAIFYVFGSRFLIAGLTQGATKG